MDVKETKRTLKGLPPRKSVLIESRHGLGKSQVVAQTAAELSVDRKKPYGFIDIRLSQREVGDIIGMPRSMDTFTVTNRVFKDGKVASEEAVCHNVTAHDLPIWFPTDPESCGLLFLDELNRATREVQQAAFELVLDYRLNFHDLPIGWRVVAATNDDTDLYSVLTMDPALYDRFLKIKFKPTVPEWMEHAEGLGVHDCILKYLTKFGSDLDTPEKIEPGKIYQSRRSWVSLSDCLKYAAETGDDWLKDPDYLTKFASGYIGTTTAISFVDFIRKEYKVLSAEDILNKFNDDLAKDLTGTLVTEIAFYNKILIKHISENKLTKKQSANLVKYYKTIPKEAASAFWGEFSRQCRDESSNWYKTDPTIGEYTMSMLAKSGAKA